MPAVVRVKRRIDEEPLGAFVLNGKKRRLDDKSRCDDDGRGSSTAQLGAAGKDELSTILKFAGTMQSQDDNAISQLARLNKDEAQKLVQQKSRRPTNLTERARQEMRQSLHENRFRVVNRLRTKLDAEETDDDATNVVKGEPKEITIVDIEKHAATPTQSNIVTPSDVAVSDESSRPAGSVEPTQPSDSDTGYVYDLYLPENEQQAEYVDLMDDDYLSVRAFDDLVYEDRFNDVDDEEYDSEDSNQENHFGNDYPDEDDDLKMHGYLEANDDDDETEDAKEMRKAVEKFVFCDDDEDEEDSEYFDQSSEDEDCVEYSDPYIHTVEANDDDGFNNDVDYCDVDRYGMAYARYKARVLKRLNGGGDDDEDDDDDDEDDPDELDEEGSQNDDRKLRNAIEKIGEMHCD